MTGARRGDWLDICRRSGISGEAGNVRRQMKSAGRRTLEEILASCSDSLFPDEMGRAPVHLHSADCDGDTALHVVLRRNDSDAALALIEAGAKVTAAGDMSETPLHIAVRQQNLQAVDALLKAGADPDAISEFGQSPRRMAAERGPELRKLFRSK